MAYTPGFDEFDPVQEEPLPEPQASDVQPDEAVFDAPQEAAEFEPDAPEAREVAEVPDASEATWSTATPAHATEAWPYAAPVQEEFEEQDTSAYEPALEEVPSQEELPAPQEKRKRPFKWVAAIAAVLLLGAGGAAYAYSQGALSFDANAYAETSLEEAKEEEPTPPEDGMAHFMLTAELVDFEAATEAETRQMVIAPYARFERTLEEGVEQTESDVVWAFNVQDTQEVALGEGTWTLTWCDAVLKDGSIFAPDTAVQTVTVDEQGFADCDLDLQKTYTLVDAGTLAEDTERVNATAAYVASMKDTYVANGVASAEDVDATTSALTSLLPVEVSAENTESQDAAASSEGASDTASSGSSNSSTTQSTAGKTRVWVDTTYKTVPVYEEQPVYEQVAETTYMDDWEVWCSLCKKVFAESVLVPTRGTSDELEYYFDQCLACCDGASKMIGTSITREVPTGNYTTVQTGTTKVQVGTQTVVDVEGHWEWR
jgi:hypothetical protein